MKHTIHWRNNTYYYIVIIGEKMNLHTYFQILSRNHVFIDSEAQDFWPGTPIGVQ